MMSGRSDSDRLHAVNGKRGFPPQRQREAPNSQHEDLIKFICDSWNKVFREVQQQQNANIGYYQEPNMPLKDFEPFDLEALWGRRVHQNITQNS